MWVLRGQGGGGAEQGVQGEGAGHVLTLLREGQQVSLLQEPLALDVASDREGPAGPAHALQEKVVRARTGVIAQ